MFLFLRYSSFNKLLLVTLYCLRFIENLRQNLERSNKRTGSLTCEELNNAKVRLCKIAPKERFYYEYTLLRKNGELPKSNSIVSLSPFVKNGLIRAGGRIQNSSIPHYASHDILLPQDHLLYSLIVASERIKELHCGPQLLLSLVRASLGLLMV